MDEKQRCEDASPVAACDPCESARRIFKISESQAEPQSSPELEHCRTVEARRMQLGGHSDLECRAKWLLSSLDAARAPLEIELAEAIRQRNEAWDSSEDRLRKLLLAQDEVERLNRQWNDTTRQREKADEAFAQMSVDYERMLVESREIKTQLAALREAATNAEQSLYAWLVSDASGSPVAPQITAAHSALRLALTGRELFDQMVHPAGRLPEGGCACTGEVGDPPCEFHAPPRETFDADKVRELIGGCAALVTDILPPFNTEAARLLEDLVRGVMESERKP